MTSPLIPQAVCSVCGAEGSGRFCANCGATLGSTTCAGCETVLSPGAHFCHRCGKSVRAQAPAPIQTPTQPPSQPGIASSLPWAVAAIALLAVLAMSAGKFFNASRGSSLDAPSNALPQAGLDDRGASLGSEGAATGGMPGAQGPDISAMSPEERADRLFNRVMLLNSQGKSDSVQFFAPMALTAYQMLGALNADQRYDMGRIAEAAGAVPLAKAQADSILQKNPTHLLGLILAAHVAALEKNSAGLRAFEKRLVTASQSEIAKKLEEYDRHSTEITNGLAEARRDLGSTR